MRLLKTLALAAILGCAGNITSFAQSLTETWTGAGGAWTPANQPAFGTTGGTLKSDQEIANGPTGSTLVVGNLNYSNALQGNFFYTLFSTNVTFDLTTSALEGVRYVQLTAGYGGLSTLSENSVIFNFGGSIVSQSFTTGLYSTDPGWGEMYAAVWTWEINVTDANAPLEFSWATNNQHAAIPVVAITQSVKAIPEPSTFGLIGAGLLLSGFVATRRRALVR